MTTAVAKKAAAAAEAVETAGASLPMRLMRLLNSAAHLQAWVGAAAESVRVPCE